MKCCCGRSFYFLAVAFFILTLALPASPVVAGSARVIENRAAVTFPTRILFRLTAEYDQPIEQVSLLYGIEGGACVETQARREIKLTPGNRVSAEWGWELRAYTALPPQTVVWWQWEIRSGGEVVLLTEKQQIVYQDDRFRWQSLRQGPVEVYWTRGNATFGRAMLAIALDSLKSIERDMGLRPGGPIKLVVYPTDTDMQGALVKSSEWSGGMAFTSYNIILAGIAEGQDAWARQVIPHEVAHLLVDSRISNCQQNSLPTWLSEGLAEMATGHSAEADQAMVRAALEKDSLPALTSLARGFSPNSEQARLAYRQSHLVIEYMLAAYGAETMEQFLETVSQGAGWEKALRVVYGYDTNALDQAWRASLGFGQAPPRVFDTATPAATQRVVPTLAPYSLASATPEPPTPTAAPVSTATPTAPPPTPTTTDPLPAATVISPATAPEPVPPPGWRTPALAGLAILLAAGAILLLRRVRGNA